MRKFSLFIIVLIGFNLLISTHAEETFYVFDEISTFIYQGSSIDYHIVSNLKSGYQVQLLITDPETGYAKIRDYKRTSRLVIQKLT
ncbi:MAG: hypothetical protein ACTS8P_04460 [Arsenophonus sp. NC-XBC3-MAG3]